jgi:hypothetical protein
MVNDLIGHGTSGRRGLLHGGPRLREHAAAPYTVEIPEVSHT